MSRNPSDVYSKLPGSVAVTGAVIDSSDYNDQIDDLVNAVNDVVMLSGSKPFTGDQSMGTHKITSVTDGAAIQDAATVAQVQNNVVQHATAVGGTADAVQVTMTPAKTTWVNKERIRWTSGGANTVVAPTISKDAGSTTKVIKKGAGAALAVGDTGASGYICDGVYNGTDLILLNPATAGLAAATTTQQLTGTSTAVAATPDSVAALWEKGSDVASSGTISLGEGGLFHITGTTTITDIDFATAKDGRSAWLIFDGILTLTHHATTLILPGGANITTAAGDMAYVTQDSTDNVKVAYFRASGAAVVASSSGGAVTSLVRLATQSVAGTATDDDTFTFSALANTNYRIRGQYLINPSANNVGMNLQIVGPASPTTVYLSAQVDFASGTTGTLLGDSSGTRQAEYTQAAATELTFIQTTADEEFLVTFEAVWRNGANAGTINMKFRRNNGSNCVAQIGSFMDYWTFT